jgi:hypothetical protein
LVIGYWLLVIGYWLLVIGYWLLVIGYWLLVIGYWLSRQLAKRLEPIHLLRANPLTSRTRFPVARFPLRTDHSTDRKPLRGKARGIVSDWITSRDQSVLCAGCGWRACLPKAWRLSEAGCVP